MSRLPCDGLRLEGIVLCRCPFPAESAFSLVADIPGRTGSFTFRCRGHGRELERSRLYKVVPLGEAVASSVLES